MSSSFQTCRHPSFVWLLACAAVLAGVPPLDAAEPLAQGKQRPELIVWSGRNPVGLTWAKLGPKGSIKAQEKAGLNKTKGLVIDMDGDGWRGCGLNWKGWYPPDACDDASRYTALVFHIKQITRVGGADLTVQLSDNVKRKEGEAPSNLVAIVADGALEKIDNTWRRVVVPLDRFTHNKPLQLARLWQIDFSNVGKDRLTFHIDRIGFAVEKVPPLRFKSGASFTAKATVSPEKVLHEISPRIYGVCGLDRAKLIEYGIPITRWGGNRSTRYNWRLGVDNAGNDWYFQNGGKLLERLSDTGYLKSIEANQAIGATTYQTVPMIGWVAKDASSYGFSVRKYGPQQATQPGHPDSGNGLKKNGKPITGNDPRDTSVEAPPRFIEEAVRYVVKKAGKADGSDGTAGVKYWVLDNEPMIWNGTHRDVRPSPLGYDELWERTVKYAEAIKRADPTAKVAGFCSWGWTDLYYSGLDAGSDNYRTKKDWLAHDKVGLAEWYIKKCAAYKKTHGKALIDVFDFHWYPQGSAGGQGVYLGRGPGAGLNELRMRSTRDLWDRAYQQESWIKNTDNYSPVALIPRVKKWIADCNPGMELCLGEYNFGGSDNVTGALAQAEVFGIMAREGLDLAFIWYAPTGTQELAWKLFRSYDGKKGRFGEHYLKSASSHNDVSVIAARRKIDEAVTVAIVNKNLNSPCTMTLDVGMLRGDMRVWRVDQDSADKVVEVKTQAAKVDGTIELTVPAASASMLVVTAQRK